MLDELRPMAVFAKTVEAGSFRAAAAALRLSPSVVSHHIAQLEGRLGVALLYRSTRRLSLTREGERLFQAARAMIAAAESGIDSLAHQAGQPTGELRVVAPSVLVGATLVDDLAAFAGHFPKIRLSLMFSDRRHDLFDGGVDVAIRMGLLKNSSLKARKLFEVRRVLVAAASYVAKMPRPRKPADLAKWDWLKLNPVHTSAILKKKSGAPVEVVFTPRLTVDDGLALYRLSKAGLGLAMVPEFMATDDLAKGSVEVVLPDWALDAVSVYAVWPPNAPRESLTARFIGFLESRARGRRKLEAAPIVKS